MMNNIDKACVTLSENECRHIYGGLPVLIPAIAAVSGIIGLLASGLQISNTIISNK